jgi:hypothetical protein
MQESIDRLNAKVETHGDAQQQIAAQLQQLLLIHS